MRIRKNAKISTLFYPNTNISNDGDQCLLHKHFCQLNQSPWDIITNFTDADSSSSLHQKHFCQLNQSPWDIITNFPSTDSSSSLHKVDDYEVHYDVNCARHGSSIDPVKDSESKVTLGDHGAASVKIFEGENDNLVDMKNDPKENLGVEEGEMNRVGEEILLCDVIDEKGWQCERVVKNDEHLCDQNVIGLQKHAVWSTKTKPGPRSMAGARSRKTKKRASTGPYEFYYYSGFGPSWGKKRGTKYNEPAIVASNDNKVEETSLNNDDTGIQKEEGKRFEPETFEMGPTKMELAYNKKGTTGKKRGGKPKKARSLKSLCE